MEPINPQDVFFVDLFHLSYDDIRSILYGSRNNIVHFKITLAQKNDPCPHCGHGRPRVKNYVDKQIKHSALQDRACVIIYHARRYVCPLCGRTYYEHNPFVFKKSKISAMTVIHCLEQLKDFNETFTSVARRNDISPTSVCSLFDQHVQVSRKPLPKILDIDEVYAFRSADSKYVCVLLDHLKQIPVDILPKRTYSYLRDYFDAIPYKEKRQVEIVCTDMYEPYRSVIKTCLPHCIHAVDHFHVSQDLHRKLNALRVRVMKGYPKDHEYYYVLKKFNWLLFKNEDAGDDKGPLFDYHRERRFNHHYNMHMNYYDLRSKLLDADPKLKEAYELKRKFVRFYQESSIESAPRALRTLIHDFLGSSIEEMNAFGQTLIRWKEEIIHSFHIVDKEYKIDPDDGHVDIRHKKVNSSIIENRNKVIKCIKHNANGYRNWQRFRNRVMYVLDPKETFHLEPIDRKEEER